MVRIHPGVCLLSSSSRSRILDSHSKDRGFESRREWFKIFIIFCMYGTSSKQIIPSINRSWSNLSSFRTIMMIRFVKSSCATISPSRRKRITRRTFAVTMKKWAKDGLYKWNDQGAQGSSCRWIWRKGRSPF